LDSNKGKKTSKPEDANPSKMHRNQIGFQPKATTSTSMWNTQ